MRGDEILWDPLQDYIILCLDVGSSMDIAPPTGTDTHLEMALRVAKQIVQQKVSQYRLHNERVSY